MTTFTTNVRADELVRLVNQILEDVRVKAGPALVDTSALLERAQVWKREIEGLESQTIPSARGTLLLEQAMEPGHVSGLVRAIPTPASGALLLMPVMAAWSVLAVSEYMFSQESAKSADVAAGGFFTWWSRQPLLSPHSFSGVIAILLLLIIVVVSRERRRGHQVQEALSAAGGLESGIAELASQVLHEAAARSQRSDRVATAASSLQAAADRLDRSALNLKDADMSAWEQVSASATRALLELTKLTESVGIQVSRLTGSLDGVRPVIDSWTDTTRPIFELIFRLESTMTQVRETVDLLSGSVASAVGTLSAVETVASDVHGVAMTLNVAQDGIHQNIPQLTKTLNGVKGLSEDIATVGRQITKALEESGKVLALVDELTRTHQQANGIRTLDGAPRS